MIDSFLGSTIDRSRTVISLLAVIMLTGIIAYNSIPIESEPDVSVPVIIITIPHEGISPEDSERLLVRPMELELKTIEGAEELHAYAGEGSATLVIEFDSSFEPGQAVLDVREAVDGSDRRDGSARQHWCKHQKRWGSGDRVARD